VDPRRIARWLVALTLVGVLVVAALRPAPRRMIPVAGTAAVGVEGTPAPIVRPVPADRPAARADAPNVVLVIGCAARRDQLAPYGGPAEASPFLATVAAEGATFTDAVATSSWTREAVAGLLTGTPAASFGLADDRPSPSERVLVPEAVTLAEVLAAAGWMTLGVTANPNLDDVYGMAQGFDRYGDAVRERGFATKNKVEGPEAVAAAFALLDARTPSEASRPFHLQVVFVDAHTPRVVSATERAPFSDPQIPLLVQDYRATLRRLDDAVRTLDDGLRTRTGDRDTLFVFVNDHGEGLSMPVHHRGGHGKTMYASTTAMPWILRGPGIPAGLHVDGLASGEDVLPTVLGLVGVPAPPVAGRDWSSRVRGADPSPTDRTRAFALSMFHGANVDGIWTADRQCQRDHGSVGVIEAPLVLGCVDRRQDPEFRAPFDDPALLAVLEAWRAARLAEGAAHVVHDAPLDAGTQGQLRALGYLDD
jgi:arylsulfatase